jgi:hypothetical protein
MLMNMRDYPTLHMGHKLKKASGVEEYNIERKWVRDCCLMLINQFSSISWWEQVNFQWDDEVCFVLDKHA